MAVLKKTTVVGHVDAILINSDGDKDLTSERIDSVDVTYGGFVGDSHYGETRDSCVRVTQQYPEGTEIRNVRQLSILSSEEIQEIADTLDIPFLQPEWVGANLAISNIPRLTQLPPSSRLISESGVSLVIDMENHPCKYPGEIIEEHHPGHGGRFVGAAMGKRGVTAWVERQGVLHTGDSLTLHIPPQRIYSI